MSIIIRGKKEYTSQFKKFLCFPGANDIIAKVGNLLKMLNIPEKNISSQRKNDLKHMQIFVIFS